jgi:hypothetical protein
MHYKQGCCLCRNDRDDEGYNKGTDYAILEKENRQDENSAAHLVLTFSRIIPFVP